MSLTWTIPVWLWPLLLVLAAGAVVWTVVVYGRTQPAPPPGLGRILRILRSCALVLLLLAVAGPILSRLHNQILPAKLAVILEDSGSMAMPDGNGLGELESPGQTRWESGLQWAARVDSALQARSWSGELVLLRGNGLEPLREFSLDDPVIPDPENLGTDLDALLGQSADHLADNFVRGSILISDGQSTRRLTASRSDGRNRLSEEGAFLVAGAGDPQGAADRLIRDLRYPETAFAGDEVVVEMSITHRFLAGIEPGRFTVSLSEDGAVLADTTLNTTATTTRIELPFTPESEGLKLMEISVSPLDNERFLANNKMSMAVNVRRGRSQLLVLAPRPGWDVRFLAQAAQAEARVDLSVVYPGENGPVFADSLVSWSEPGTWRDWARWDGVVLIGWQDWLARLDWKNLESAISEGMGFLVVPEVGWPGQRQLVDFPEGLAGLLPVSASRPRWNDGPFLLSSGTEAEGHPILRALSGGGSTESAALSGSGRWSDLPPLRRVLQVQPKPEVGILLEARRQGASPESAALPVLVVDGRQNGRVAWLGGQRLWEQAFWRPPVGPEEGQEAVQPARRLLQNLLVWLSSGQEDGGLSFTGHEPFYQEGERVTVTAQWTDMRGRPVANRDLTLRLTPTEGGGQAGQSGQERSFSMIPVAEKTELHQVVLPPMPPGRYQLQLVGQGEPLLMGPQEALVITAHSIEETQVRQDARALRQLADRNGGTYVSLLQDQALENALSVLDQVDWAGRAEVRRQRWDFWSGWPFLVLVVMLLAAEWYLRRRHGLL